MGLRFVPVSRRISDSTVRRLSHYLRALETIQGEGGGTVSSEELAGRGHTTAAQVRKDLSHFGSFGKRGLGYNVQELMERLRGILGLDRIWRVVLVGAGRIGSALFEYPDFKARGYDCVAIVDADPEKIGTSWGGTVIRPAEDLEAVVQEYEVDLVILAVPAPIHRATIAMPAIISTAPTVDNTSDGPTTTAPATQTHVNANTSRTLRDLP